jgi:hypothetical protein
MLKVALLTLGIVTFALILLCIKLILVPRSSFGSTHIGGSKAMREKGIYCVHMDAYAEPEAAGLLELQLTRNGVPMPEAISAVTGAVGSTETLSFETFVQVSEDNTPCCCTAPTQIAIETGDVAFANLHINVKVSKLC